MRRRQACQWGAFALATPLPLRSQPRRKARIGVLFQEPRTDPAVEGMFTRLAELGWSEIRNLSVEYIVFGAATSDFKPMVDPLPRARCELIVALGTPVALAVKAAAPSMPMVFAVAGEPVALGLVSILARPGGNATGLTHASHEHHSKLLALLREVVPRGRRFAVMLEDSNPSMRQGFDSVRKQAEAAGLTLRAFPLRDVRDIEAADLVLTREPADGLVVFNDRVTSYDGGAIVRLAGRRRLAAAYGGRHFVDGGGLMSYGINWPAQLARTAEYVARILDGARPADLPVERPSRFDLVVNMHTARAQGISLPQSLLLQATEVVKGDIVRLAALNRVPAVYASRYFLEVGGLLSYGINWPAAVLRTAEIAARVLDGTKPADLPVERVSQFELLVNQKTARALGISVPQSVLAQATEVLG